jgi:hypothetical protein
LGLVASGRGVKNIRKYIKNIRARGVCSFYSQISVIITESNQEQPCGKVFKITATKCKEKENGEDWVCKKRKLMDETDEYDIERLDNEIVSHELKIQ